MSTFEVYLWTQLDGFHSFLVALIIIGIASLLSCLCAGIATKTPNRRGDIVTEESLSFSKKSFKYTRAIGILTFCLSLLKILVPTQKGAAIIYVLPQITNSKIIKQIPEDLNTIYKIGIQEIKEAIVTETKVITEVTK